VANSECIKILIKALMNNLTMYKVDQESVYSCFKHIGLKHPDFIGKICSLMIYVLFYYLLCS